MASKFVDDVSPFLYAKLQGGVLPVAALWVGVIGLCFALWQTFSFTSAGKLPKLPIALAETISNPQERMERWTNDTRNLLSYGYKKYPDQPYGVDTTEGISIIIPLHFLDVLKGQRALTFSKFLEEDFTLKEYSKLGNLTTKEIAVYTKNFNPLLAAYTPVLQEFIKDKWPIGKYESFTPVKVYPHMSKLAARISARMFLSLEAAENDDWIDIAGKYVHTAMLWTGNLRLWPKFIRPYVYTYVDGYSTLKAQFGEGRRIVSDTLQKKKAIGGQHLHDPPSLMDLLTDPSTDSNAIDDVEAQTITQMNLVVAANQALSATVMQSIIELATHSEYVGELREEVMEGLKKGNGQFTKQILAEMLKLDSFIKETQRFYSPDLTSFQRKAGGPVTLSNGWKLPDGARLVLPTSAIYMDEKLFPHPEKFDGFRFYRLRQESKEAQTSHQMVSVGKKDLTWGYGKHACPGRFMAEVVMKLLVAHFLLEYDVKLIAERPKNWEFSGLIMPDKECELLLRSRRQ